MSIYGSPFVVGDECGLQIQCRVEWMNTVLASLTTPLVIITLPSQLGT